MLFAHAFDRPDLLGRIRRFRKNPVHVYGSAFVLVSAATLIRLGLHQELSSASPFTAYSLATLCMALAGGFYPGMVTLAASLVTGAILFLPPAFSFTLAEGAGWPLIMFALFGGIEVVLISGLIAAILLHDEHQQFLFGELRHRSRNLFSVVQGIASRTLMESQTLSEAKEAIELRLAALARTHAMLADSGWTGAPLEQIVSEELTSFANQVSCIGCSLVLNTPAAQSFSLIIHELATNAVKHGALSRPEGRITIQGRIRFCERRDLFEFSWIESGGPAVQRPQRKGFGSSILNGMAKRFAQHVEASYRPEGLMYELHVPLGPIQAPLKQKAALKITGQLAKAAAGAELTKPSMQTQGLQRNVNIVPSDAGDFDLLSGRAGFRRRGAQTPSLNQAMDKLQLLDHRRSEHERIQVARSYGPVYAVHREYER